MGYLSVIITVITLIVSIFTGFFALSRETMESFYINSVYYILLLNVILFFFSLIRAENNIINNLKIFLKKNAIATFVTILIIIAGYFAAKPDFKILADETNLLSMSQSLYEEKECKNYTSVLYYYYGFKNVISYVNDKRPALFPFTISIVHSLFGYRPENIFIVNIISSFICLLLLYQLISFKFGRFWGICGMLMLSAYPLYILYTTSGGFEIFNLLFILLVIKYLIKFLDSPQAVSSEVLLLLLPLLGQTRYESVLAVFCILPVIFVFLPRSEFCKFSYKLPFVPLFFIPIAWLRIISDSARSWQVADMSKSFSAEWFFKNLKQAVIFFFSGNRNYGIIPVFSVLAMAGLIFLICELFEKRNKKHIAFWISILLLGFLHAVARFSYSMCDFTSVTASRLAIVFLPFVVFCSVYFLYKCKKWFCIRQSYIIVSLLCFFIYYWPSCGMTIGIRDLTLYREFKTVREYLEKNYPDKNNYILVADRANMYVPLKYSTISFDYLRGNTRKITENFKNRTYEYMILVQTINKESNIPLNNCRIPNNFELETLYESQTRADRFIRISKWKNKK